MGREGSHLGLQSVIGFDTYLDTPNADLKDAAGGRVKVHGEPSGGGNLHEGQGGAMLEAVSLRHSTASRSLCPFPQECGLAENRHPREWTPAWVPFA